MYAKTRIVKEAPEGQVKSAMSLLNNLTDFGHRTDYQEKDKAKLFREGSSR